jgi:hypothetical protein
MIDTMHIHELDSTIFLNKMWFHVIFKIWGESQVPNSYYVAGPVMSKFTTAFRELGTYKELLRSQVLRSYSIDMYHFAPSVVHFTHRKISYWKIILLLLFSQLAHPELIHLSHGMSCTILVCTTSIPKRKAYKFF